MARRGSTRRAGERAGSGGVKRRLTPWPDRSIRGNGRLTSVQHPPRMKTQVSLLLLSTLVGCASVPADAPGFAPAPPAPAGYATVYLYRVGAFPTLRKPNVMVNQALMVEPPELSYTWAHVKAGAVPFRVEWAIDTGWPPVAFSRDLASGQSYYFKLSGSSENKGLTGYNTVTHVMGTRVAVVAEAQAQAELLTCCKYIKPERQVLP